MKNKIIKIALIISTIAILFSCKKDKALCNLIQDCPDEKIINKMPPVDLANPNEYYIYKGVRKEIEEFDNEWVKKNCVVKESVVY